MDLGRTAFTHVFISARVLYNTGKVKSEEVIPMGLRQTVYRRSMLLLYNVHIVVQKETLKDSISISKALVPVRGHASLVLFDQRLAVGSRIVRFGEEHALVALLLLLLTHATRLFKSCQYRAHSRGLVFGGPGAPWAWTVRSDSRLAQRRM